MINDFEPFINRLRSSGLRPTKQRLIICKLLFDRKDTFHFTIDNLNFSLRILENDELNKPKILDLRIPNKVITYD